MRKKSITMYAIIVTLILTLCMGTLAGCAAAPAAAVVSPSASAAATQAAATTATSSAAQAQEKKSLEVDAIIEISAGSNIKYELDPENGTLVADRFQSMPVVYPANYGSIAQTKGEDGDPLDILLFTRQPLNPNTAIKARPIGYLKMVDGGDADEKVIAVPASKQDPSYDKIKDIGDLSDIEQQRIQQFFTVYKNLPEGGKAVEIKGFENAAEAEKLIGTAGEKYKAEAASAKSAWVSPLAYKQSDKMPENFYAVIEIPQGSNVKYEIDPANGQLCVDRFQSMPVAYPLNYGCITQSKGGDGDPLDVLVFARTPLKPGAVVNVRAIGYLKMTDGGDADEKVIAVPASKQDPTYDNIKDIADLPEIESKRISAFFEVYKQLPPGNKEVKVSGYAGAADAQTLVKTAVDAYLADTAAQKPAWISAVNYPQADKAPEEMEAVVEIPAGSSIKYEYNAENGMIVADRFTSMSVVYPANYGSLTQTKGADGDPLDVLIFTRTPLEPGSVIKVRPIGYLGMKDGGDADEKVLAVPVSDVDPTYDKINTYEDLPAIEKQRIEAFFKVYKNLPASSKAVELTGFYPAAAAKDLCKAALDKEKAENASAKSAWANPIDYK